MAKRLRCYEEVYELQIHAVSRRLVAVEQRDVMGRWQSRKFCTASVFRSTPVVRFHLPDHGRSSEGTLKVDMAEAGDCVDIQRPERQRTSSPDADPMFSHTEALLELARLMKAALPGRDSMFLELLVAR